MDDLAKLLADLTKARKGDNALDCRMSVAFFKPTRHVIGKRLNDAQTKVIYTYRNADGSTAEATGWAGDLTTRVDFALELFAQVLPGHRAALFTNADGHGPAAGIMRGDQTISTASARSLPLALCAAIVQAKLTGTLRPAPQGEAGS
jgi:hypothetical protein